MESAAENYIWQFTVEMQKEPALSVVVFQVFAVQKAHLIGLVVEPSFPADRKRISEG